jgi:hypothetical protein
MPVRSESPDRIVVGIDDTDMPGTPGTGRLARVLCEHYEQASVGRVCGVTRHQLFEGPGVPKTSHNSAAAIVLIDADPLVAGSIGEEFLLRRHAEGSDPGIAVLIGRAPRRVLAFALRAQRELVTRSEAESLAAERDIYLRGLAGTRDGVIGALSAAALRADGGDGRFVGLRGIRGLHGKMTVRDILSQSDIAAVVDEETGTPLGDEHVIETRDWVRPRVVGHLPVLVARRNGGGWVHADARTGAA